MKAYVIKDRTGYCEYVLVVFAETRGKAISIALGTDEFPRCDYDFTQLKATRIHVLDKAYRGKMWMDWDDPIDRLALVRDVGFHCNEDSFYPDECKRCAAKDYCSRYEEYLDEESDEVTET